MENQEPTNEIASRKQVTKSQSDTLDKIEPVSDDKKDSNTLDKPEISSSINKNAPGISKKPAKPPKLEDKPFKDFISNHLIPRLKESIEDKGSLVSEIKLIEGNRPVVGGNCWMVFCELSEQRKFWLCFSKDIITSDKTILLAESNSDPSIVESFLIDEKKTTLPLLISRVLQRLNGQKWIGAN
ncbi:DUF2996 domain-containing protein [Prochlorococcus sp. MIT 0801]|uniref:DUF2996 domain-containing protein n=1 Tax=Prochlorococcus sp. MIT 0801 TaxID=1501269 RepID=UPI0004F682CC|nr:DUF2996 domain-containing protein [Prochlorococcus sp. MIT 0801]AIQ97153.1 Type II secretory pathway [Prochlorococcus sp. MIT 0801]